MLVLNTTTDSRPEVKGLDGELEGGGGVTLSGSMTRQVSAGQFRPNLFACQYIASPPHLRDGITP